GALSVSLVGMDGAGAGPHTPSTMMANTLVIPIRTELEQRPKHHRSSPILVMQDDDLYAQFDQHAVDRLLYRLNQETYKNDTLEEVIAMLRSEAQTAQSANQMLRADVSEINRALETVQAMRRNDQLAFQDESARFRRRNEQQNRQLIELFHAFKAHRRQVDDLRQTTKEELDRQLAEFKRAAALMSTALGQKHTAYREEETIQDMVVKYERLMEKNLETEKEKSKQILKLESTLKRTSDERDALLESLGRIAKMPELISSGGGSRTRSVSPTGGSTVLLSGSGHLEIQRKIRSALSTRNSELRDLISRTERAEIEADRLKKSLEKTENEAKMNHDEKRTLEQREKKKLHEFAELERNMKRAQERISAMEEEKKLMGEEMERLQKTLTDALKSHKDFIDELSSRHREEITDRVAKSETEAVERIAEMKSKMDRMREDSEREKTEVERIRINLRDTVSQLAVMTKRCEEYDHTNSSLELDKNRLGSDMERLNERLNESEKTVLDLRLTIDERTENETKLMQRVTELNSSEALVREDSAGLQEEVRELRRKVEEMTRNEEKNKMVVQELRSKHSTSEEGLNMSEKTIKNLRLTILSMEQKLEEKTSEHLHAVAELEKNIGRFDMATKDLLELQETLMEFASERDTLAEALSTMKLDHSAMEAKVALTERKLHDRSDEEGDLRQHLEVSLANVRKLEEELGERTRQLEMTRDQLVALEGNFKRQDITHADELKKLETRLRDEMASTVEELETKMKIIRGEKNSLEETLNASEKKLNEIVRMHDQLMENYSLAQQSIQEWRDRAESVEVERRRERNELVEANTIDREEWESEREKLDRQRNNSLGELRDEMTRMEHDLKETTSALEKVMRERDEAIDEIETMRRRMDEVKREGERQREASLHADAAHTNERHNLFTRLEEANLQSSKIHSLLDQTQRKQRGVEEELVVSQRMLTEKSRLLIEVETSLNGLMERLREAELRENSLKDSLASTEGERDEWRRNGEEAKRGEKEAVMRANELNDRLLFIERELHLARSNLDQERTERTGGKERVAELTKRAVQLESVLVSRTTQVETFKMQISHLEEEKTRLREKMELDGVKAEELVRANETLRRTLTQLKEELNIAQRSMDDRSSSSRHAMDELLVRFRDTDSKLVETSGECDRLRNTVHTLSTKLDRLESSRAEIERKLSASEGRRNEMEERLNAYERSARNALNLARPHTSLRFPGGISSLDLSSQSRPTIPHPVRNSHSTHDLTHHHYKGDHEVHFESSTSNIDVSASVDVTIRYLKDRIDRLEADKIALTGQLGDHSRCILKIEEAQAEVTRLQRRIQEVEEEKKHLEGRLHSQRQLYLSHEESIASKDREGRGLRNKLASTELRIRERESHMQQITTQLESVKTELIEMTSDRNRMVDRCRQLEDVVSRVEEEKMNGDRRREELETMMERMEREGQALSKRLEEAEAAHSQSLRAVQKLRVELDLERDSNEKLKHEEEHWRNTAHTVKRSAEEYRKTMLDERLASLQRNYDELNARNEKVVEEAERLRKEVREATGRATSAVQKSAETDRRLDEVAESRKALHNRLLAFERKEGEWNRMEKEMGDELKMLRKDKLILTSENEELKRKVARLEIERREIDVNRTRLEREVIALKKHIETLEEERNRREISLKEALAERKAIDKSLATMEKENAELYRSCSTLQAQISQLERDAGGPRSVAKLLKDHADLEAKIGRINAEKRQMELTFSQRESNHAHKHRMMETQLSMLKEQLETERRRKVNETTRKQTEIVTKKSSDRPTTSAPRKPGYR
ncbi:hypothetical protein PENTCL1PPCAC_6217, partial [Pristionchus entomophagus]